MGAEASKQYEQYTPEQVAKVHERIVKQYPFLANIRESTVLTDFRLPDNPIVFVSDEFERLTLYPKEEILGRNCRFLQGSLTNRETVKSISMAINGFKQFEVEILNYRKDGVAFWNCFTMLPVSIKPKGPVTHFIAVQKDVTLVRKNATPPIDWSTAEVALWLDEFADLHQLAQLMSSAGVDGPRLISLDTESATNIGVPQRLIKPLLTRVVVVKRNRKLAPCDWPEEDSQMTREMTQDADDDDSSDKFLETTDAEEAVDACSPEKYRQLGIKKNDPKLVDYDPAAPPRMTSVWNAVASNVVIGKIVAVKLVDVIDGIKVVRVKRTISYSRFEQLVHDEFHIHERTGIVCSLMPPPGSDAVVVIVSDSALLRASLKSSTGTVTFHVRRDESVARPIRRNKRTKRVRISKYSDGSLVAGDAVPSPSSVPTADSKKDKEKKAAAAPSSEHNKGSKNDASTGAFETAFDRGVHAQLLINENGNLLYANEAAEDFCGIPVGDCFDGGVDELTLLQNLVTLQDATLMPRNNTARSQSRALRAITDRMLLAHVQHHNAPTRKHAALLSIVDMAPCKGVKCAYLVTITPVDAPTVASLSALVAQTSATSKPTDSAALSSSSSSTTTTTTATATAAAGKSGGSTAAKEAKNNGSTAKKTAGSKTSEASKKKENGNSNKDAAHFSDADNSENSDDSDDDDDEDND